MQNGKRIKKKQSFFKIVLEKLQKKCKEKEQQMANKRIQQKEEKMFPTKKIFLENPSICMALFNPYAPMQKFCACFIRK